MRNSKVQIVATIGLATKNKEIIKNMIDNHMDVARLNFSWGTYEEHANYIKTIREIANIPIIQDLSGSRIQKGKEHGFDDSLKEIITKKDLKDLEFGIEHKVDYIAMSFVGSAEDILKLRNYMGENVIPIIAKIERKIAVENIDEILKVADAIMIARGDLGNEVPLEKIPFIEKEIISKCKKAKKPVIVATQMMLSMTENRNPTRAEVTDVVYAVSLGADAIMLSEETASGGYPVRVIEMMEKISLETEKHYKNIIINPL